MGFCYIQIWCQPFIIQEANDLEFVLLGYLAFITASETSSAIDHLFISVIVSFLILIPIPMLFYYIYKLYQQLLLNKNNPKKYDDLRTEQNHVNDDNSRQMVKSEIFESNDQSNNLRENTMDVADMITNMVSAQELGVTVPVDIDDELSSS